MSQAETTPDLEVVGINWKTTIFLAATLLVSLVGVPLYVARFGFGAIELTILLSFIMITGMTITSGYHRLFTHRSYSAHWPVRLAAVLFGAAAFQMSALQWSSEHRYHHKHTDEDGDPHDPHSINRGFFWAHMGWLLVKVDPRLKHDNVPDLEADPIVAWQHRRYLPIAVGMGFLLPMAITGVWAAAIGLPLWQGLLAGFLFGACLRIVIVHHLTWFINSLAHTIGRRPYDGTASSRDSGLLAVLTFGEGYHNFHHAFQTDYRNGIRAWHFDPSKWVIWLLSKVGLTYNLRRVPAETIRMARLREKQRQLSHRLAENEIVLSESLAEWMGELEAKLEELHVQFRRLLSESARSTRNRLARSAEQRQELQRRLRETRREFRAHFKAWMLAHRQASVLAGVS